MLKDEYHTSTTCPPPIKQFISIPYEIVVPQIIFIFFCICCSCNKHQRNIIQHSTSGDILTDVSVWAGETMYSAHRLVLALSSHYFRVVVTGVSGEGKHPVIFLKVKAAFHTFTLHFTFGEFLQFFLTYSTTSL